jgi:hypothetical protein
LKGLVAPLGLTGYSVGPGETLTADVVIQNKGIAHSHVPEQRDMYESWVEFTVKDSTGKVLHQSGFIKANGDLDERAHSFTNRLININGGLNDLHQVWTNRVVAYNNTIQSGRSQLVRYSFIMPAAAVGPVTITATVKYRRFDQHFMDFGMGKHYEQPIVDMVSQSRTIQIGENKPEAVGKQGMDALEQLWDCAARCTAIFRIEQSLRARHQSSARLCRCLYESRHCTISMAEV